MELRGTREEIVAEASALRGALAGTVVAPLVAERAEAYIVVLWGLARLRRAHELEPLHEDVVRLLVTESYASEQLAHDLEQLAAWGCVAKRTEALKIRGYRDARRERFRWRLTSDAVALLEWLESRLVAHHPGRAGDSRDLLADVKSHAMEAARLIRQWRDGERPADSPRRVIYLLAAMDELAQAIAEELLGFRAAMLLFTAQPYEAAALRAVLGWLDQYVERYVRRLEELRQDVAARLDDLALPRHRRVLAEHEAALAEERARTPRALGGGGGGVRRTEEVLEGLRPFFAPRGGLAELCARIDDTAREVLRKMHRHLKELERRSARIEDLRARVREIASAPMDTSPAAWADFLNALVASAHVRFAARRPPGAARALPPLPRRHLATFESGSRSRPLAAKGTTPETVRELRARRLLDLAAWIERELLRGAHAARLSTAAPAGADAARRWLDVARARWLGRAGALARLGVTIAPEDGAAQIGDEIVGLEAPDCTIRRSR